MTLERADIADRLRPLLSAEPQTAGELMARAGLSINRRLAGVTSAALRQLRDEGTAKSHGAQPNIKWTRVTADQGVERLPLARLDATLILTTTARTTAGGTRRTELAATVELGPSWPSGTRPPPRWSTAFSGAQLATGALDGARTNARARAEAQLRALRAGKTLTLLPTEEPVTHRPNPLLLPSKNRETFFSYLASVQPDGARRDSACTRLATLGLATTTAEAERWLDEAVEQGLLAERTKRAGDGTTVVRYLPVEPTTPAPLPKSSAPAEEAPAPAVAEPKAKPARETRIGKDTYRGAPPKPRPAPVADEDTGDPTDDEGALDDPAEHDSEDPPQVEESGEVARLSHKLWEAESKIKTLEHQVEEWDRRHLEADRAASRDLAELKAEADLYYEAIGRAVPHLRGTSPKHMAGGLDDLVRDLRDRAQRLEQERDDLAHVLNRGSRPQHYQGDPAELFATSIAGWLVGLSDETWLEVTRARHQLAESRRLREESHSLEHSALDALDRAVGARPAAPPAPAPAPELVPDPIPLGPAIPATPEPPASGEQANDGHEGETKIARALAYFRAHPTEEIRASDLVSALEGDRPSWASVLQHLFAEGAIERVARGAYRLAQRKGRRAA